MNKFTQKAYELGWKMKDIANRWDISPRQMSNIAKNPKTKDYDALNGLPKINKPKT